MTPETMTVKVLFHVRNHVAEHARACSPFESVGLIAMLGGIGADYWPLENVARSATRFRVDPHELLRVLGDCIDSTIVPCLCHSHVEGDARPSHNDLDQVGWPFDQVPYFIYSVRDDDLAAWRLEDKRTWRRLDEAA